MRDYRIFLTRTGQTTVGLLMICLVPSCVNRSGATSYRAGSKLASALTFHASFDTVTDADLATGDPRLQIAPRWGQPRSVHPGQAPGNAVHIAPNEGRFRGALRFERKIDELIAYRALGNLQYQSDRWAGTVSFWLRVSPDADLAPGYCDAIQITSKDWNDASFYTDFTKDDHPRQFRLGASADLAVWNPKNLDWESFPPSEKPLVVVAKPPFSRETWTHVAFTWENYNTGQNNGVTRLYLDGHLQGELRPTTQTYTWDPEKCLIMLGLGYTGWMDDLAIFNRALTPGEILQLHNLPEGVKSLR